MQFVKALPPLLQKIHEKDLKFGPVYISKIVIADGFYCLGLQPRDTLKLGVLFPTRPGEPPIAHFLILAQTTYDSDQSDPGALEN